MASTSARQTDVLEVDVSLEVGEDEATLRYAAVNRAPEAVFVFNRLWERIEPDGSFATDPDLVWVVVEDERVVLGKKVPPVPEDMDVESRVVPVATRLAPGESIEETVRLVLPLESNFPYPVPPSRPVASALEAFYELGYVRIPPEGEAHVTRVETADGPGWYFSSFRAERQSVARIGPLAAPLPVSPGEPGR